MSTTRIILTAYWRENMRYPRLFLMSMLIWPTGLALQYIILPLIVARAIDELITTLNQGSADWTLFAPYAALFAIVGIIGHIFTSWGMVLLAKLETEVRPLLQEKIFNTLVEQSLNFHANTFSGSLVNQANRYTSAYVALTDTFIINILELAVKFLVAIIAISIFSPTIALVMFSFTVVLMIVNYYQTKKRMVLSRVAAAADSLLTAHLADTLSNIGAVKSFSREADESNMHNEKSWDRANKKYASWIRAVRNGFTMGILMLAMQFTVLAFAIHSVLVGHMAIGIFLLIQVYLTQLISVLWGFGSITRSLEQQLSDATEMAEILQRESSVKDPSSPQAVSIVKGGVAFTRMQFGHEDSNGTAALFKNFNLQIAPGEKIGLVGHSGSGKTTLTRLLLRFADINEGSITIDGQDIRSIRQSDLRARIAYVPQEPLLFHRSIRENIAYGKPDASDKEVRKAAQQAYAAEFIEALPNGYDTLVGERGVKLSGGQRQRIAIARAILKDAPILVLDEATSALDSESERLIQQALKHLMQGRTTIVIAHRLSTIQTMDRIVVLQNGAIIEQGPHHKLLQQHGTYAELWKHQSGGFLEE